MQRSGIISPLAVLCALAIIGGPSMVWAQGSETASEEAEASADEELTYKQWAQRGSQAFADKDYEGAVDAFNRAYALNPVPNLLYNIGRALEKQGKFQEANDAYTRFVTQPDVELKARQDALQRIETLKKVLALQERGQEVDAEEVDKEQGQHQLAATDAPAAEDAAREQEGEGEAGAGISEVDEVSGEDEEAYDYTLAYIFGGAGAAALVGSGVFAFLAHGEMQNAQDARTLPERREANDSGETFALVADSLLAGGIILAGVGLAFWLTASPESAAPDLGESPEPASTRVKVSPQVGLDRAGMSFSLDF